MSADSSVRDSFIAGIKGVAPTLIGVLPFGTIVGGMVAQLDISMVQSIGLSAGIFAGLSELIALELFAKQAPIAVVIATALIVNLRMAIYSASIAPYIDDAPLNRRIVYAYLLTDQAYAVSIAQFLNENPKIRRHAFYVGAAIPVWVTWQVSHFAGYFLGSFIPPSWSLEFAVPLTFMAVLISILKNRQMAIAAIVAGVALVMTRHLPNQLGLIAAAAIGVTIAMLFRGTEV